MKDIDFDELDRAVSSVLGQKVAETKENNEETAAQPNDEAVIAAPAPNEAEEVTPTPAAEEPLVSQSTSTASLAVKRRGKFMDVMHPSADMSSASGTVPAPSPRTAAIVKPLSSADSLEQDVEPTEPTAELDESHALIGAEPAPVDTALSLEEPKQDEASDVELLPETATSNSVTDLSLTSTEVAMPEGGDAADEAAPADAPSDEVSEAEVAPLEADPSVQPVQATESQGTPFLTDTQVEKRPLGAFGAEESESDSADGDNEAESAEEPSVEAAPAAAPAAPLPRELQPDVVGVESIQEAEAREAESSDAAPAATNPFATNVAAAPETSDGRVEGHPLFDTSTYHEPVAAVSRGPIPGWLKWLIGLLLCLAVGSAAGYVLFTFGL